jgi:hypothetical protein
MLGGNEFDAERDIRAITQRWPHGYQAGKQFIESYNLAMVRRPS